MFCPTCGEKNDPNAIICVSCGSVLPGLTQTHDRPSSLFETKAPPPPNEFPSRENSNTTSDFMDFPSTDQPFGRAKPYRRPEQKKDRRPNRPTQTHQPDPTNVISTANSHRSNQPDRTNPEHLLGKIKLVVEQGKILGEQFLLADPVIMIGRYDASTGRCPDIDLTAQDPAYVHRQHVRITFEKADNKIFFEDMGGRNGSYVNNQLLESHSRIAIHVGDKVRVGRVVMRLLLAPELSENDKSKQK